MDGQEPAPTGVPGLDDVLRGGLPAGQIYLLEGTSGAGKTTLGLQFLLEGVRLGEPVLWCTLSETEAQLRSTARAHGWDLSGVTIANVADDPALSETGQDEGYSFFSPGDIELQDVTKAIMKVTQRLRPRRIVFDPFSDVKLLARDPLRYRRQLLQLRSHFIALGATVLLIQEYGLEQRSDPAGEGVVNGIIALYQDAPDYGKPRRRLRVHKLRAVGYREGFHDVSLRKGGIVVYPRLSAGEHALPERREQVACGIPELDQMLGGGLDRGSSLLVVGPSGAGKSTLCSQFAVAAERCGDRAVVYLFDETRRAYLARTDGLGMGLRQALDRGHVQLKQINPAEFSPGEFAHMVRADVEAGACSMVVIDSMNGYLAGMTDESHLAMHMHELLTYLSLRNVLTLLTMNQRGMIDESEGSRVDVSYLADAAVLLRYFEAAGAVRRALSVLKRRCGAHEDLIREFSIGAPGIVVGPALHHLRGVLTGQPESVPDARGAAE